MRLVLLSVVVLGGCNGSSSAVRPDEPDDSPRATILITQSFEPAGANCTTGGIAVHAGADMDNDGELSAGEISNTQYICHGNDGGDGLNALITVDYEAPGADCANGGRRISLGLDANRNDVLDEDEITSTDFVCNGTDGTDGTSGLSTLMLVETEPAGANCSNGGSKVSSGLDSNRNGLLDVEEVMSSVYVCDGAPGAPGPGISWVEVTGAAIQAVPNTGYVANNNSERVAITLPTDPAIGDMVQVTGAGYGGWRIAQNDGQIVFTSAIGKGAGNHWAARHSSGRWGAIASSADGTRLIAANIFGQIYTSTNSGAAWTHRATFNPVFGVASSADGLRLAAAVNAATEGRIFISTDGGANWTARGPSQRWQAIASSADGMRLLAAPNFGQLYTSTDGGATWMARETDRNWTAVASSADGMRLVAAAYFGQLYISTDGGANWIPQESNRDWTSVAASADGMRLVASVSDGLLYVSSDGGANWLPRDTNRKWKAVASSADGSRLIAVVTTGQVYTSVDSGITWTAHETNRNWLAVASSADGNRLAAAVDGGHIYTSVPSTTLGTAGGISGELYDSVDLQYIGSNTFMIRDYGGNLSVY